MKSNYNELNDKKVDELELGKYSTGVFHNNCIDRYFNEYVPFFTKQEQQQIKKDLEERLKNELYK